MLAYGCPTRHNQVVSRVLIETSGLVVAYGRYEAVRGIDLQVRGGEVYGLIGHNGAGKTSTMRVLATLQPPSRGEVRLAGMDVMAQPADVRALMGFMPDLAPLPGDLKVIEMLRFFAEAHGLFGQARDSRVEACLEMVSMRASRDDMCGSLSRGMTQRVVAGQDPAS